MMSRTTTVRVVVLAPSAVTLLGLTDKVEVVLLAAPAVKVTLVVRPVPTTVAVTVFSSARVEARVAVTTPEALVVPELGVKVLLEPVLVKVTV